MTEKLLQFIWQFQYINRTSLQITNGDELQIIHQGQLNTNQGPDFINARIKINKTILVGSIELHIKSSDWYRHHHNTDKNYSNVVLHVVYKNDMHETKGLPVLELEQRISRHLLDRYETLMDTSTFISCASSIHLVKDITLFSWKERLLAERLTRKAQSIISHLKTNNNHWEESFWWALARSFGGKVNNETFEAIAQTLPVTIIAKHKNQIHQLEALLFGQANLLMPDHQEDYPAMLFREYQFLKKKYQLKTVKMPVYFLRMRPGNFPTIRLAQLAMLIHNSSHLFSQILKATNSFELKNLFRVTANDYWHYHYRFDESVAFKPKRIGESTIDNIFINTIIPTLFAYGLYNELESFKEKALKWMEEIKAEENVITKGFTSLSINNHSAFDSQALIELKNEYCIKKSCLQCAVGSSLLKQNA